MDQRSSLQGRSGGARRRWRPRVLLTASTACNAQLLFATLPHFNSDDCIPYIGGTPCNLLYMHNCTAHPPEAADLLICQHSRRCASGLVAPAHRCHPAAAPDRKTQYLATMCLARLGWVAVVCSTPRSAPGAGAGGSGLRQQRRRRQQTPHPHPFPPHTRYLSDSHLCTALQCHCSP